MHSNLSSQLIEHAERLEEAAHKLREAAKVLANVPSSNGTAASTKRPSASAPPVQPSRLDQLRAFLEQKGPMFRREIIAGIGIPKGTVAMLLNKKDAFAKDKDGRWRSVNKPPEVIDDL